MQAEGEAADQREQNANRGDSQAELEGHAEQTEESFAIMSNLRQALCRAIQLINTRYLK